MHNNTVTWGISSWSNKAERSQDRNESSTNTENINNIANSSMKIFLVTWYSLS